jgi:hypothetical protein
MLPSPSYIHATTREFDNPREILSNDASKDARVATWWLDYILICEHPAQSKAKISMVSGSKHNEKPNFNIRYQKLISCDMV